MLEKCKRLFLEIHKNKTENNDVVETHINGQYSLRYGNLWAHFIQYVSNLFILCQLYASKLNVQQN